MVAVIHLATFHARQTSAAHTLFAGERNVKAFEHQGVQHRLTRRNRKDLAGAGDFHFKGCVR